MANSLTDFAENLLLTWLLTAGAATRPTTWFAALFTATPTEAAGGGTEIATGSYARKAVAWTVSGTAPTKAVNSADVEFVTATANWGSISHSAIHDALTTGNQLAFGTIKNAVSSADEAQTINSGNIFRFNAGDLEIDLD